VPDLQAQTIGGVIAAGEPLMNTVPGDDDLAIAAQVQPQDLDKIQVGSEARIRLSAFNELPANTAEQLNGLSLMCLECRPSRLSARASARPSAVS
jgi:multidrug resistance efflux pump